VTSPEVATRHAPSRWARRRISRIFYDEGCGGSVLNPLPRRDHLMPSAWVPALPNCSMSCEGLQYAISVKTSQLAHATAFFIYLRSTFNSLYNSILCILFSYNIMQRYTNAWRKCFANLIRIAWKFILEWRRDKTRRVHESLAKTRGVKRLRVNEGGVLPVERSLGI